MGQNALPVSSATSQPPLAYFYIWMLHEVRRTLFKPINKMLRIFFAQFLLVWRSGHVTRTQCLVLLQLLLFTRKSYEPSLIIQPLPGLCFSFYCLSGWKQSEVTIIIVINRLKSNGIIRFDNSSLVRGKLTCHLT